MRASQVGVIGHRLGAVVAAITAARPLGPDWTVLLSTPARPDTEPQQS